ncbi:hypothetical protein D3C81_1553970 [compost metagenome]
MAQLRHDDRTLLRRGQRAHDRRLQQRHQGHVGVGRHGNRAEQLRRQLGGHEDRGRAVGTADDGDRGRFLEGELHARDAHGGECQSAEQGTEDAELRGSAEQQGLRVGQHRPEVGHRPHAHEDQQRKHAGRQADFIEQVQDAHAFGHVRHRDVGENAAETDGDQQQRLEALADRQVDQADAHRHHQRLTRLQMIEAGALPQLEKLFHAVLLSRWSAGFRPLPRHRRP